MRRESSEARASTALGKTAGAQVRSTEHLRVGAAPETMGQDGANRYAYVYNHPTAFIDPSGFDAPPDPATQTPVDPAPSTPEDSNIEDPGDNAIDLGMIEFNTDTISSDNLGGNDGFTEGQAYGENVGNQFGSDAVFGDGFDSGEASVPKFELAAVRTGPDPASDTNGGTAQKSFWASFMIGAAMNPAGAVVALAAEGAVLVGEAIVAVEENLPEIKAVGSEVVTEASELGSAEMSRFSAETSAVGSMFSRLGSFVSDAMKPLFYGPSAEGKLAELAQQMGGETLTSLEKPVELSWTQFSAQTLQSAAQTGRPVFFDLSNMSNVPGVLNGTAYPNAITSFELQYIQQNWDQMSNVVQFMKNGSVVSVPW